jgi:hypothetical protein
MERKHTFQLYPMHITQLIFLDYRLGIGDN